MEKIFEEAKAILAKPYNRYQNLDQLYIKIKNLVPRYFDGNLFKEDIRSEYEYFIDKLNQEILNLPLDYISDTNIVFKDLRGVNNNVNYSKKRTTYTIEDYLDYVVYYARKKLIDGRDLRKHYDKYDVTGRCCDASYFVKEACDLCDLKCYVIRIEPGFEDACLFKWQGFHYFVIVEHKGKYYLVDVSYKQFFQKKYCSFERMGVPLIFPPMPGAYMVLDSFRNKMATVLNKYGWILLTEDVLKAYLDGFALSFRNALFYEDKDIIYETPYTAKDYKNFLCHEDSQIKHEGTRVLGYQLEPIKNPNRSYQPNH